jgi:hypothetical protein
MKLAISTVLLVVALGCATVPVVQPYAREVKKKPQDSGVIALHTNPTLDDRKYADTIMKQNCDGHTVKVIEEGEVAIGEQSHAVASKEVKEAGFFGRLLGEKDEVKPTSDTTKVALKEWQIVYQCQQ